MTPPPGPPAPGGLADMVATAIDAALASDPANATYLGEHRHDDQLADPSASAAAARAGAARAQLAALDATATLTPDETVDAAVLRTTLSAELLQHDRLGEAEWNPMTHNPGGAIDSLLSRDFAPWPDRYASVAARLELVPEYLGAARSRLDVMSRIHVETAIAQFAGTAALIDDVSREVGGRAPSLRRRIESAAAGPAQPWTRTATGSRPNSPPPPGIRAWVPSCSRRSWH